MAKRQALTVDARALRFLLAIAIAIDPPHRRPYTHCNMTTRQSIASRVWPVLLGLSLAGCASSTPTATAPAAPAQVASSSRSSDSAVATGATPTAGAAEAEKELDKLAPPTIVAAKADDSSFTVNAMIGQINGRPIYASTVLEPLEGQIRAWGSTLSPRDFRLATNKLIGDRLYQIVFDQLFLGEAERNLSEQERFGLKVNLRMNREELVRRWGAGSAPQADEEMRRRTGKGLDETLNNIKQTILIRKYQDDVIMPRITVSRRDVERFYYDPVNYEKFNPKPGRKIRIIRVATGTQAGEIDRQLGEGKPFAEVAAARFNQYNRETGGLMTITDDKEKTIDFIQGDKVFGLEPLNEALVKLKAGQTSPRITTGAGRDELHWWLHVEQVNEGKQLSIREAQLQIEQQIRGKQYQMLEQRYRRKLFEDAGYNLESRADNPLAEMGRALVEVAVNVYGPAAAPATPSEPPPVPKPATP